MNRSDPGAHRPLASIHRQLRATGRGKHVGGFSYYHKSLIARVTGLADRLDAFVDQLDWLRRDFDRLAFGFNVIKLDTRRRISFLCYETFDADFPALLAALSCDLERAAVRRGDYESRRNPPILHRKELLLPVDDPRARAGALLTERLERLGAFRRPASIGTREGWRRRLRSLGLDDGDLSLLSLEATTVGEVPGMRESHAVPASIGGDRNGKARVGAEAPEARDGLVVAEAEGAAKAANAWDAATASEVREASEIPRSPRSHAITENHIVTVSRGPISHSEAAIWLPSISGASS